MSNSRPELASGSESVAPTSDIVEAPSNRLPQISRAPADGAEARSETELAQAAQPSPGALSARRNGVNAAGPEQQLVIFTLADENYALDISVVESIIKMQSITVVAHAHSYVEGVTNLRGTVLPVIDLSARFGLPRLEATKDTRIVVVEVDGSMVGLVVDAVTEVLRVPLAAVEPPSPFVSSLDSAFVTGLAQIDDRLVILLDLNKVFSSEGVS